MVLTGRWARSRGIFVTYRRWRQAPSMLEKFVARIPLQLQCERGMANACNQLVSAAGFAPQQWVLGAGHQRPASLANPDNDPSVVPR
eukprot:7527348-Pyramimonas_sp.AAC.1